MVILTFDDIITQISTEIIRIASDWTMMTNSDTSGWFTSCKGNADFCIEHRHTPTGVEIRDSKQNDRPNQLVLHCTTKMWQAHLERARRGLYDLKLLTSMPGQHYFPRTLVPGPHPRLLTNNNIGLKVLRSNGSWTSEQVYTPDELEQHVKGIIAGDCEHCG